MANYYAWRNLKEENLGLLRDYNDKTCKYKIIPVKYFYDFQAIEQEVQIELRALTKEIEALRKDPLFALIHLNKPGEEQLEPYRKELEEYLASVKKFQNKLETREIIHVSVFIKNTSKIADRQVNIKLEANDYAPFISLHSYKDLPYRPSKPRGALSLPPLVGSSSSSLSGGFRRDVIQLTKSLISVEFTRLLADEQASLVYEGFLIEKHPKDSTYRLTIKSEFSGGAILEKVSFDSGDTISIEAAFTTL